MARPLCGGAPHGHWWRSRLAGAGPLNKAPKCVNDVSGRCFAVVVTLRPLPRAVELRDDGTDHAVFELTVKLEGEHAWHGRCVVKLLMAADGAHALQVRHSEPLSGTVQLLCLCKEGSSDGGSVPQCGEHGEPEM
jgi:hypothetical protein